MARQVRSDRARLTPADYIPDWIRRGGPGSGHFGHAGRPGQRGGSAPGDGETSISEGGAAGSAYDEQAELQRVNYEGPHGRETIGEWLTRHEVKRTEDGLYRFFHATPKRGGAKESLRSGSLLEFNAEDAAFFAARDRDLDPQKDIIVYQLDLRPSQIDGGQWASLREEVPLSGVSLVKRVLPMLQDFAAANWEKVPHFTTSRLGGIQGALWIAPDGSVYDPKVPHFQSAIDAFRGVGKIGDSAALAAQERGDQGMARDLMRAGFVRVAASVPNRMLGFEHPDFHSLTPEQRATIDNESQHAWQQAWTVETDFGGMVKRGGPGSGHFGHAGRPGQRGGSLPGEGGTTISEARRQGLHSAVDALKVPRTEKWRPVSDALAAIDSVHGISGVPLNLKVLALSATSNAGHLRVERGPGHFQIKNMSLRILREGETAEGIPQHLELTTAHEFGHTLDWTAFQGIQKSSGDWGDYDKPMQGSRAVWYLGADNDVYGVMKAIKESEAYTALKVESMPNKAWPGGTEKLVYDSETMRYLREPEELFARAYAQYVAVRSGNEPMLNAVADLQNAAEHGHPPLAWDDKDFQSIAGAFDRMFGERGWR